MALEVLGYQFPDAIPSEGGFDWDANWLVVRGVIKVEDRSWSFTDPCLTTQEAAELGDWLRQVALGEVVPGKDTGMGGRGARWFVEPNVSVMLSSASESGVSLLWHFSQESAPTGAPEEQRFGEGFPVAVTVPRELLLREAGVWADALTRFPQRGPSPER